MYIAIFPQHLALLSPAYRNAKVTWFATVGRSSVSLRASGRIGRGRAAEAIDEAILTRAFDILHDDLRSFARGSRKAAYCVVPGSSISSYNLTFAV